MSNTIAKCIGQGVMIQDSELFLETTKAFSDLELIRSSIRVAQCLGNNVFQSSEPFIVLLF